MNTEKKIWTIGHSTHPLPEFLSWLKAYGIELLVDVRRYPGSRRHPQFNQDALQHALPQNDLKYQHFEALGGRRKARPDSVNFIWRHPSFRGYADHMETDIFKAAAQQLQQAAQVKRIAYMCSEAVWWSCHRSLISDYLKVRGWQVNHIMAPDNAPEHPYTKPARIIDGKLSYEKDHH